MTLHLKNKCSIGVNFLATIGYIHIFKVLPVCKRQTTHQIVWLSQAAQIFLYTKALVPLLLEVLKVLAYLGLKDLVMFYVYQFQIQVLVILFCICLHFPSTILL